MPSEPNDAPIAAQLDRVLRSKAFGRSPRLSQFLRFVVERALDGNEGGLKEVSIGVELFGREPGYDSSKDAVVRTTASRVRQKLALYYQDEGQEDEWRIELPADTYIPKFVPRTIAAPEETPAGSAQPVPASSSPPAKPLWLRSTFLSALVVAAAFSLLLVRQVQDHGVAVAAFDRVTNDGFNKIGPMLTDGAHLYFRERLGEWRHLKMVRLPVAGGEATPVQVPFGDIEPMEIAPGPRFLLRAPNAEGELSLCEWSPGAQPVFKGPFEGQFATWVAGAQVIEVWPGNELHLRNSAKRMRLAGPVLYPRWSSIRNLLRFTVDDTKTETSSIWETGGLDAPPHPVAGLPPDNRAGSWTPDGRLFVFLAQSDRVPRWRMQYDIWAVRENRFGGLREAPVRLTEGPIGYLAAVPSPDGKHIYALGRDDHGVLVRFNKQAGKFVPLFEHLWATQTDFSHDGKWMAYVSLPDRTLWKVRRDGSEPTQLTVPPIGVHEPHWSPDGSHIAFMGEPSRGRYRLYQVSSAGGTPSEMAPFDHHDQGVPTWSPDGGRIVFGDLKNREPGEEMSIHVLDVSRQSLEPLPDSKGLWTARWSPDGKRVLALSADNRSLQVFDWNSGAWRELARMHLIEHPAWSADSSSIYFVGKSVDDDKALLRASLRSGKIERLVDLNRFEFDVFEWFGIDPEGTPLALQSAAATEVYSLTLR